MKKIILILTYVFLLWYLFFGASDNVIYSDGEVGWLLFLLVFPVQALVVYLIARSFSLKPYTSKGVAAIAILVSAPLLGIYLGKKQGNQLSVNGVNTFGVVYKKWKSYDNNGNEWLLRCNFQVNGVTYSTASEIDRNNRYHIGDTLHIEYFKDNPKNCIIMELKNK